MQFIVINKRTIFFLGCVAFLLFSFALTGVDAVNNLGEYNNIPIYSVKTEEKKQLEEAFVLWKNKAKSGLEYLSGKDLNDKKLVAFFNTKKENPKEPDIRVYNTNDKGEMKDEVAVLWENTSKDNNLYLTGSTKENEKLVAWYGKENEEKRPYVRAYFQDNE